MFEITIVKYKSNPDSEYIGRGSVLGNPYPITHQHSRDCVCDKYEEYFYKQLNNKIFNNELKRIYRKGVENGYIKLGCFCSPLRCHGETIKNFLENNQDNFFDNE